MWYVIFFFSPRTMSDTSSSATPVPPYPHMSYGASSSTAMYIPPKVPTPLNWVGQGASWAEPPPYMFFPGNIVPGPHSQMYSMMAKYECYPLWF